MTKLAMAFSLTLLVAPVAGARALEVVEPGPGAEAPLGALYDNGPLVNSPGTGPGGADESLAMDTTAGLTSRGFNHSLAGAFRVADDFTVTGWGWNATSITFFPYMGGSPTTPSPITGINLQIWDGSPDLLGSTVIFGDTATNRLTASTFANLYRRLESQPADATRPVMASTAAVVTTLAPGTYWLDWQVDGDVTFTGPWAPPVTIDGQTTTGNALQSVVAVWQPVVDAALLTPLGLPFLVDGTLGDQFLDGFETSDMSRWSAAAP